MSTVTGNPSDLGSVEVFLGAVNLEVDVKAVSGNTSVSISALW